jgi:hypothetical protein
MNRQTPSASSFEQVSALLPSAGSASGRDPAATSGNSPSEGMLILNADDWGRDRETTARTLDCVRSGTVSSTSAMVFMEDAKRASSLAREWNVDAGLHLNLSEPFTAPDCPPALHEQHCRVVAYLRRHPLARIFFHPGLTGAFDYVVAAQLEEFQRLYGAGPRRIDGHHHLHLCANVQRQKLLPEGTIARRNFTFRRGEKSLLNRLYRKRVDGRLARRHQLVDCLFLLPPLQPASRLRNIFSEARRSVVEVETHPVNPDEYKLLTGGEIYPLLDGVTISTGFTLPLARTAADMRMPRE